MFDLGQLLPLESFQRFSSTSISIFVKGNFISHLNNFLIELLGKFPQDFGSQEIRKYKDIKFGQIHGLVPSLLCRNKILTIAIKKLAKADIKVFQSFPSLLNFYAFFQVCPRLQIIEILFVVEHIIIGFIKISNQFKIIQCQQLQLL